MKEIHYGHLIFSLRIKIFTAMIRKITVFWDVTLLSQQMFPSFSEVGTCYCHLQARSISQTWAKWYKYRIRTCQRRVIQQKGRTTKNIALDGTTSLNYLS
jgi:hypothetical protein